MWPAVLAELHERSLVNEQVDALTRRKFPSLVLLLDFLRPAAELDRLAPVV